MKTIRFHCFSSVALCSAIAALFATVTSLHSEVIYRQNFGNANGPPTNVPPGANLPITDVGWLANTGPTGVSFIGNINNIGISGFNGSPTNLPNINAGDSVSDSGGFFFTATMPNAPQLFWTDQYVVDRSVDEVSQISFYGGNANIADIYQIAIQIGDDWFVTTQTFAQTVGVNGGVNFTAFAIKQTFSFTSDASAWADLDFVADTVLAMGSVLSSPLPSGSITAFGLYVNAKPGGDSLLRFDTFQIDVGPPVPEPSSLALLSLFASFAFLPVIRRKVFGQ